MENADNYKVVCFGEVLWDILPSGSVPGGGDGVMMCYNGHEYLHNGYEADGVDTAGSGDAFPAGLISKLPDHASLSDAPEFASGPDAFIATQKGACPGYDVEKIQDKIKDRVLHS
ncbi:MAG: PfkB family carbohydrate kinase [Ginsengibacter sp.]